MDLKRLLMNLEKPESHPMDDFLHGVNNRNIADSLVVIQSTVSDMDLIQYTLNALDSDYGSFIDGLTHMPGLLTFDGVRNKLIVHEHRVQLLKRCNTRSLTHPMFVSTTVIHYLIQCIM